MLVNISKIFMAAGLMIIFSLGILPDGDSSRLESRLKGATGNERLDILVELTKTYGDKDRAKALSYGKEALELMRSIPDSNHLQEHLGLLTRIAYRHGDYMAVSEYAVRRLEIADKTGDEIGDKVKYEKARALHYLGKANKYLANYDLAIESVFRAKSLYEQLGDENNVAFCLNSIGLIYRRLNDYSKALEFVLKAGEIWNKLGDKENLATVFNNSGIIHRAMGNLDTALEHLNEGLSLYDEANDSKGVVLLKSNIASIYNQQGKSAEALEMFKKVLAQEEPWGEKKHISITLLNIALCYKDQGDFQRALIYLERAKKLKEEIKEYFGIAGILVELGAINRQLGNREKAYRRLDQALKLAAKIQAPEIVCEANKELSTLFEEQKDFPNALAYHKKFKEVNDTLFNENNSKSMAEMQARFDMERKEKEIFLLKKDKHIRQLELKQQKNLKNLFILVSVLILILAFVIYTRFRFKVKVTRGIREKLAGLVEERTRELEQAQEELVRKERLSTLGQLTATVAHEIRNPLGTVRSSIFSLGKLIEKNNMSRVKRALELAERNIVRCDKIIDDLLNFTRQRQLKLEPTKIDPWLEEALGEQTIPEQITCIKELNSGVEISCDRERLLRAFTNAIDNAVSAMQDGNPPGNRLTVRTLAAGHRVEIRVSDEGVGIPEDIRGKIFEPLFSTKTFGFGLGLPVVKTVLEEHGGGVDIRSRVGQGTTAILWLPVK